MCLNWYCSLIKAINVEHNPFVQFSYCIQWGWRGWNLFIILLDKILNLFCTHYQDVDLNNSEWEKKKQTQMWKYLITIWNCWTLLFVCNKICYYALLLVCNIFLINTYKFIILVFVLLTKPCFLYQHFAISVNLLLTKKV